MSKSITSRPSRAGRFAVRAMVAVFFVALLGALPTAAPASAQNDSDPSFGSQFVGNRTWTRGVAIAPYMLPQATGGTDPITYSLSPSLPTGLTFTASTRAISGTPTAAASSATYTYTATDEDDETATLTFSISVVAPTLVLTSDTVYPLENGKGSPLGVRLAHKPSGTVTVSMTSAMTSVATATPASLTFTSSDWEQNKEVTVVATPDANTDDDSTTLTLSASGANYEGVSASATVKTYDDQQDWFNFSHTPRGMYFKVYEGNTGNFELALKKAPTGTVTVTATSPDTSAVTVDTDLSTEGSQSTLTFTTTTWNQPQTINLIAVEDPDASNESFKLGLTATGGEYDAATGSLGVTAFDNDRVRIRVSAESIVATEGSSTTLKVRLASEPSDDVTVTASFDRGIAAELDKTQLTFTEDDWNTQQDITVSGTEDDDEDGHFAILDLRAEGGDYSGQKKGVRIGIEDNDYSATPPPAILLSKNQISIAEGSSDAISVSLATEPSKKVVVQLKEITEDSGIDGVMIQGGYGFLEFRPGHGVGAWYKPQTVPIAILDDARALRENKGVFDILVWAFYDAPEYKGRSATVTVTGVDNDDRKSGRVPEQPQS